MDILIQLMLLIVGFILLVKGADYFVDGAAGVAVRFGIPQLIIGLTIVAMGTSAPEAAVSIAAAFQGSAGITIGNVIGSNIMNTFLILGLTAAIVPVAVQSSTIRYELPFMIGVSALLPILGIQGGVISFTDGIILWALFLVYLGYLLVTARRNRSKGDGAESGIQLSLRKQLAYIIVGIAAILLGSEVAVSAASSLARSFGISERVIGLTIVALGTSLPELFTSVTAALKGNADIAVGNIVGSNIFNILFVAGTTALITDVTFETAFFVDGMVMLVSALMLLIFVIRSKRLTRLAGILMLLADAVYLVALLL